MWILTFIVCVNVVWFSGVDGQSIELHPFNPALAKTVCQGDKVLVGDSFGMTATLNATGTDRDEWPLDRIILQERWETYAIYNYPCYTGYKINICEINIERDGCGEPTPDSCGYCNFKQDDVYHLVFNNITVTEQPPYDRGDRVIDLTWEGKSETRSSSSRYPSTLRRDLKLVFPEKFGDKILKYVVNGSISQLYSSEKRAPYTCVDTGNGNTTWYLPRSTEKIVETTVCLNETIYDQLITKHPVTSNIRVDYYDFLCPREGVLISPLFYGYVRDPECEMKIMNNHFIWVCAPPTYSLCISMKNSRIAGRCIHHDKNDTTFFTKYLAYLWVLEQDTKPTFSFSYYFSYEISQYTECTNDTGAYIFTVNESHSVIVRPGDNVTFSCEIYGFPIPNAQLLGPAIGQLKTYTAMVYLLNYTLDNLQCEDSGRYVCKVDRGYGATIEARQKFVDVNVVCPPKLNISVPDGQTPIFKYNPDEGITIDVYGYPAPTNFILRVTEDNSTSQEVDKEFYSVIITPLTPPLFRLSLNFHKPLDQGTSTTVVLQVNNGEGSGLDIQFVVIWNSPPSESLPTWLIAVVTVSCTLIIVIIIVLIIVLVLYCVRRTTRKTRSSNSATNKERDSYDHAPAGRNDSQSRHRRHEHHNTETAFSSSGSTSSRHTYIDPIQDPDYIEPISDPDYGYEGVYQEMDEDGYVNPDFL